MIGRLPSGSGRQLNRQLTRLLLLAGCLSVSSGCVTQPTNGPLAEAQSNLKEARKARSDPRIAAADYLEAADVSLRSMNNTTGEAATEVRLTYNSACQELALLLRDHNELWDRAEVFQSHDHLYRLHFAGASRQAGTWGPAYLDFFRTPRQLRVKRPIDETRQNGWGGILVGVHKPPDPRKYFLPRAGLAVPVTAVVDIARRGSQETGARDVTFSLYRPGRRETIRLADVQEKLAADFVAPTAYYSDPLDANLQPDSLVKKALIFDPNPHVSRIVFICVPHRGSYLATNWIGSLGVSLIRLPVTVISRVELVILSPLLRDLGFKRLPTGINGLSPRSPVLRSLDTLPIAVPYYSIIGDP